MKFVSLLLATWATLAGTSAHAVAQGLTPQPIPAALKAAVTNAEQWGRKLFDNYDAPAGPVSALIERAAQTAHAAIKRGCPGRFKMIVPDETMEDGIVVYEIAEHRQGFIVIGGQTRVLVSPDGATALSVTPSAKSCFTLEPPAVPEGSTVVSAFVTHLLSPAPTEFHVLANLLAKQPLYVATEAGVWLIDKGAIGYAGPMPPPPE